LGVEKSEIMSLLIADIRCKVANEMRSGSKIWSVVGSFLVIALLSLSVCINACADIAPASASDSCPHHHEDSDCCKHPSGDSATLGWHPQKQHPQIVLNSFAFPMNFPMVIHRPVPLVADFHSAARYFDASGPPGSRILSLRI